MKSVTVILTVILVLLLGGCSDGRLAEVVDQFSSVTESPTPAATDEHAAAEVIESVPATAARTPAAAVPTAVVTELPTATLSPPTATPSPTPSATPPPTPTPPAPEAILGLALYLHEKADTFHFEHTSEMEMPGKEPYRLTFTGDYIAPYTVSGEVSVEPEDEPGAARIISYAGQYYETPLGEENWRYYAVEPGRLGRSDVDQAWLPPPYAAADFSSLTYEGIEELDGSPVYSLHGVLPGSVHLPPAAGDVAVEMSIGVEDGYLRRYVLDHVEPLPDSGEVVNYEEIYLFSHFNQAAVIDIPDVQISALIHEEPDLGLSYAAPGDWTIEGSGDGCAQGSCPEITLYRDRPGGPHSTVTLTLLSSAERPFLQEVMTPPEYEETELGGMPARVRRGEAYVDGLIYPDQEHALQLSARWEGHAEEEAAIWQILDSLASTAPPVPGGFTRHTLPGWGSIDIPEDWHFVNPPNADQMVFSSADVDFTYDAGPEDALVTVTQVYDPYSLPILLVEEEYLPSLPYEWEALDGPKPVRVGGMAAATVTYDGYEGQTEMLTVMKSDDGRLIVIWATAGEDVWHEYEPLLFALQNSIDIVPTADGPQLSSTAAPQQGYAEMRDEEQGYAFAYPEGWQFSEQAAEGIVFDYLLTPPGTQENEIALVKIYPPSTFIVGEESANEQFTAAGQLEALANWSGDLTIRDAMSTSRIQTYRTPSGEYAASYFGATKDGRPIYGFMGAMTDGDLAVKMIAWFEDPAAYEEEVLAIFNSIQLTAAPELHRDTAETLPQGARFDGRLPGPEEQFLSFEAGAGQTFLMITQMNTAGLANAGTLVPGTTEFDVAVYDPRGTAIGFQPEISSLHSGLSAITAEEEGQYLVRVRPYNYMGPVSYIMYLLPAGEGQQGTLEKTSGALDGDCQEFSYEDVEAQSAAVNAAPTGEGASQVALALTVLDSAGSTIYECAEFCAEPGMPTVVVEPIPDDGAFSIRVCELNDQPAEFELIVATLPQ